jgi:uncharacterized protein YkwD
MRRKLPAILPVLCLLSLAPTPASGAVHVANHRIVPEHAPPASGNGGADETAAAKRGCATDVSEDAPTGAQLAAMRCLVDQARRHAGLGSLANSSELSRSAKDKAADILRCKSFSHYACGREFTFWMKRVGYLSASCWRVAENIAWATGPASSPRAIFRTWMHSPEHRANILGHFSQVGVGLRVGSLNGHPGSHVWTGHFGTHC